MSAMTGGYASMAEACGEAPWQLTGAPEPSHVFTADDLAEMHPDDLEGVLLVTENDRHRQESYRIRQLQAENARLRRLLGHDDDDRDDLGGE